MIPYFKSCIYHEVVLSRVHFMNDQVRGLLFIGYVQCASYLM